MHVAVLAQSSVANHVLKILYSCAQVIDATVTSLNVTTGVPPQSSVDVAVPVFAGKELSSHSMVTSAGQKIVGATKSVYVSVWLAVAVLPQLSVAVQVLVIDPPAQLEIVSEVVTESKATLVSQLSVATGVPNTGVVEQVIVASAGTKVKIGASVSTKVKV